MSDSPSAVKVGEKWTSMRSKETGEVIELKYHGHEIGWSARLRMSGGRVRWVTCGCLGIKGYRKVES